MGQTHARGLVVGLGVMGTNHLRVLSSLPGVEITAVVDPDEQRRTHALALRPALRTYEELSDALAAETVDFACLAVPVPYLVPLTRLALAAGLAALVEKPMAATEEEALSLIHEAEERQLLLSVGLVERCNPAVVALKRKLDDGALGRIYQLHARRLSPFPERSAMVGASLDLATHDVDVMRYLTGSEIQRVYAETAQRTTQYSEDLICASLRFDSSATGLLEVNWITPTKVRELSVTGERGMFVVDYLTQDLYYYENARTSIDWEPLGRLRGVGEGNMTRYALERREPLVVQWEAFLRALRGGPASPVGGHDGLAALSVARAIQRSGESHLAVAPSYRELEPVAPRA